MWYVIYDSIWYDLCFVDALSCVLCMGLRCQREWERRVGIGIGEGEKSGPYGWQNLVGEWCGGDFSFLRFSYFFH